MYKGSTKGNAPALLRSYDSRREPAPEFDCKIWEAGRATCAIGLAFKPIQIGQSVFHDDGAGNFNPSMTALDEAVVNEWPGREVGVFISVGTGKRPKGSDSNAALWYEGFLGEFAEARRKLIAKIEGCERIHEIMKKEHLAKRGVNIENYYRLNVEVGVGEFGMNEWHRLADISTKTRQYLAQEEEQKMVQSASAKLAKIHFAKQRWERLGAAAPEYAKAAPEISLPLAVELPGDFPIFPQHQQQQHTPPDRRSYDSGSDMLPVPHPSTPSPRSSVGEPPRSSPKPNQQPFSPGAGAASRHSNNKPSGVTMTSRGERSTEDADRLTVSAPTPAQYRTAAGSDKIAIVGPDDYPRRSFQQDLQQQQQQQQQSPGGSRAEPPPLPPKTPLPERQSVGAGYGGGGGGGRQGTTGSGSALPYPLDDDTPPVVNLAKKPVYRPR
jgi:hypothetical protein